MVDSALGAGGALGEHSAAERLRLDRILVHRTSLLSPLYAVGTHLLR